MASQAMGSKKKGAQDYLVHLDWIRAYAMLFGVPHHAALIYYVGHPWFISSSDTSLILSFFVDLIVTVRMPIFFILAGLLSAMILARRDSRVWLRGRIERLLIPMLSSMASISVIVILGMAYQQQSLTDQGGSFRQNAIALLSTPGSHWIGHLWFLQALLVFSCLSLWGVPKSRALIDWLKWRGVIRADGRFKAHWLLLVLVSLIAYRFAVELAFYIYEHRLGLALPFWGMLRLEPIAVNAPYFFIGVMLYRLKVPRIEHMRAYQLIVAGAIGLLIYGKVAGVHGVQAHVLWYVLASILASLGSLMIFNITSRHMTQSTPLTKRLIDGSFTVYLVHYPIVVWLGLLFVDIDLPVMVEFVLISSITLALSFAFHQLVRQSNLLRFLFNGVRFRPLTETTKTVASGRS